MRFICLGLIILFASPLLALSNPKAEVTRLIQAYVYGQNPDWLDYQVDVDFKYADQAFAKLESMDQQTKLSIVKTYQEFKPVGNVIFPLEALSQGKKERFFIRAKVKVLRDLVVANQRIKRGQAIGWDAVVLQPRDIAMLPNKYLTKLTQAVSQETKTTIPKGSIIFNWMVKKIPLLRRGETVTISLKDENLSVKTTGKLLSDGYFGGKVKVKTEKSKDSLEGIVKSSTEVEVRLK